MKRKSMKSACYGILALFSMLPLTALAQDGPDVENSFFISRGVEIVPLRDEGNKKNPLEFSSHVNSLLQDFDRNLPTNLEELEWESDLKTYPKAQRKIDPVERKNQVNQYQPLAGHLNLLGSKAIQKAYDKALEGPVAEWNITLTQTEPAIAAGVHNALVQTANTLNSRYLSELVFYDQLDNAQPWARTKILDAYNTCIHKQINEEEKIWYEALQVCSGDSADDEAIQPQYDEAKLQEDKMWQIKLHHRHQLDGKAVQDNTDVVSVVDELFAELLEAGSSPDAEEAQKSWLALFGDIQFKADSESRKNNKGALSSTELMWKRVMPQKRPGEVLGMMIKDRYAKILKIMHEFCEWKDGKSHHDTVDQSVYQEEQDEFWQKTADQKIMRIISTEGYIWNPAVANMFLEMTEDVYSADGATISKACDAFKEGSGEFYKYLDIKADSKAHDIASTIWNYSKFVSYGQLLSGYKQAVQFVYERSSEAGDTGSTIRDNGLSMIYETARHNNIPELQLDNLSRLRGFLRYVYMKKAQDAGSTGRVLGASPASMGAGSQKNASSGTH